MGLNRVCTFVWVRSEWKGMAALRGMWVWLRQVLDFDVDVLCMLMHAYVDGDKY